MIKYVAVMLAIGLVSVGAMGASLNFIEQQVTKVGVTLDGEYYVVTVKGGQIIKIEYKSEEETDLQVETSSEKVWEFLQKQGQMTELEKIKYITQNFGLPADLVLEVAGNYMGNM